MAPVQWVTASLRSPQQAGYDVIMSDIDEKFVQGGIKNIDKFLTKSVEKGKMTADAKAAVLGKIKGTTKLEDMKDADFVVEVVPEMMDIKLKTFKALDEITKKDAIFDEHVVHVDHRDRQRDVEAGEGLRHALLQPCAPYAAGRSDPRVTIQTTRRSPSPWTCRRNSARSRSKSRKTSRASSSTGS